MRCRRTLPMHEYEKKAEWDDTERGKRTNAPVSVYCAIRIPITATYAGLARSLHPPVPSINVLNTKCADWWLGAAARMAMTTAVVPTACHQIETLLMYLSRCTPNVLIRPCATRIAA